MRIHVNVIYLDVFLGKTGGEMKWVMKRKSSKDVTSGQELQNTTLED